MPQTIGFIGVGPINGTLARFSVSAGLEVILSNSRGPETLKTAVAILGDRSRAATVKEAARASDIVVVSVPLHHHDRLPVEPFVGKPVVDTMNYYPQRVGRMEVLESRSLTSSEMVQRHLKGAYVIKAFHTLDYHTLGLGPRAKGDPVRWALPIAGDDARAKGSVAEFMDAIGFDPVDCGSLAESWRIQQASPSYGLPYVGEPPSGFTLPERRAWFRRARTKVVTVEDVRRLAAEAKPTDRVAAFYEDLPPGLYEFSEEVTTRR